MYKNLEFVKSALIFASGKVVFTGAKTKDSIDLAFAELKVKMVQFFKKWSDNNHLSTLDLLTIQSDTIIVCLCLISWMIISKGWWMNLI